MVKDLYKDINAGTKLRTTDARASRENHVCVHWKVSLPGERAVYISSILHKSGCELLVGIGFTALNTIYHSRNCFRCNRRGPPPSRRSYRRLCNRATHLAGFRRSVLRDPNRNRSTVLLATGESFIAHFRE